jgi:Periplasmic binding protein
VIGNDFSNDAAKPEIQYYYTTGNFFASALVYKVCKDMVDKGINNYVSVKPDTQMGHFIDPQIDAAWRIASGGTATKLGTIFVDPATVDFGSVATKIVSYNTECADLIYLGMVPNSVPQVYKALADIGFEGTILPGIASVNDVANLSVMVGNEIIEGGEVFSQDPTGYQKDPRMLSFFEAYAEEYGQMEYDNTSALMGVLLIEDAINATQSIDVEVIKAYLDHMDHPVRNPMGWTGLYARPDLGNFRTICGGPSHPVARITDGVLKNFSMVTQKEQYLFSIMANNMVDVYKAYWEEYGYPTFPEEEEEASTLHFSDLGITGQD